MMEFTDKDVETATKNMFHTFKREGTTNNEKQNERYKKVTVELSVENSISEMKNMLDRIHSRVNTVELKISKFEAIKQFKFEQREKRL